jgi:hypothetical protein
MKFTANRLSLQGQRGVTLYQIADSAGDSIFFMGDFGAQVIASSGVQSYLTIEPDINQTSTAGYTGIHLDVTETGTGSGENNLLDLQVGSVSKFRVDNTGQLVDGIIPGGRDFALSDETSDLTTGTKLTWYPPYAVTLTGVFTSVTAAPTDATLIVDIHLNGTTIMTTDKIQIETAEFHSSDAATQPALTTTAVAQFDKVEIIIDQIGSSVAGAGLKCYLLWIRTI